MAGFGWDNPFPMEFGSGPTIVERHYDMLRRAPGKGGVAKDQEDSLDAIWRAIKATAMAALDAFAEAAAKQTHPGQAEELLYYYEDLFVLAPPVGASLTERQEAAEAEWVRLAGADGPTLEKALQRIDERFEIIDQDYEGTVATTDGRMLEPFKPLLKTQPHYGGRPGTSFPNVSSDFTTYALMKLGDGVRPSVDDQRKLERARRLLGAVLPSWCDFRVLTWNGADTTPTPGFKLDVSLMDLTAFGA